MIYLPSVFQGEKYMKKNRGANIIFGNIPKTIFKTWIGVFPV